MRVFLTYLTFSPHTAYNRLSIFNFGIQDVYANPIFGIGPFNLWSKPSWMHSDSMDNFWLYQAVHYGAPACIFILLACIVALSRNWAEINETIRRARLGWSLSMIGLIIAAATVHLWHVGLSFFGLLLGIGAWFSSESMAGKAILPEANASAASRSKSREFNYLT